MTDYPLEYRLRRVYNGKNGIHGQDYVRLGIVSLAEAQSQRREHLEVADEVHIEQRQTTPWVLVEE